MHFSKTGQCLKHLNEESLSVTSFCVCAYVSWDVRWIIWSTTLTLKTVLLAFCVQNFTYDFVLNWHVHWYICTAVWYVLISFIIASWYWFVTVFVIISQSWPVEKPPNIIFFATHSGLFPSTITCVCVCDVVYCYWTLWFLYMKDAVNLYQTHAPDPFCPPQQMTCYRSVFTHVWGQHLCRLCPQSASSFLFFYI